MNTFNFNIRVSDFLILNHKCSTAFSNFQNMIRFNHMVKHNVHHSIVGLSRKKIAIKDSAATIFKDSFIATSISVFVLRRSNANN